LQVAQKWYQKKKKEIKSSGIIKSNDSNINDSVNPIFMKFAEVFVKSFWNVGMNLEYYNMYFTHPSPRVKWVVMDKNISGNYNIGTNSISLNTQFIPKFPNLSIEYTPSGILSFINNEGSKYFSKTFPASTVIHELEHAWRRSNEGFHDDITIYNILENKNVVYNFEEAANYMYDRVISNNLISEIIAEYHTS